METRKIYAILLSLIIPLFAYGNEVNNPSMEGAFIYQSPLGNIAEYWTGWTETGGPSPGAFSEENSYAHEGSKSQEIRWDGWGWEDFGDDGIYQQISPLQPGQTYRLSVWFKYHFQASGMWGDGEITCSVGTDPNGGTNPDVVTNWTSVSDWGYGYYEGPWFKGVTFFSPNGTTATLFIKANGYGMAEEEDLFCCEFPPCDPGECPPMPAPWDAYCYIDDVNVQLIQISQGSTVSATSPIPANGVSYSEVTITVVDSNGNPIEDIPPWEVVVDCTGSGNFILGPDTPTDVNGQTTARITSTVSETKTVSATVLGTVLSDTAIVQFYEPPIKLYYVDPNATGANDGTSWDDAFNYLQDALSIASLPGEIRVADGTYLPDATTAVPASGNRYATFQLINGVGLYGGYAGCGAPDPNARDIELYETILSGDLNGDDGPDFANNGENSYHVVTASGTDETALLDGFIITAGNANGSYPANCGGGMYSNSGSPTLINCTFSGNSALAVGGGMYNFNNSSPTLTNCTFNGNYVDECGGAMQNEGYSNPTLTNCIFSGNSAGICAGGIRNYSSSPTLVNCIFSGNSAGIGAGGMDNADHSSPTLTNCIFSGNSAIAYDGGGMYNINYSDPTLTNCIFSGNSAGGSGGGLYNCLNSSTTAINCTFSGNSAPQGGGMHSIESSSTVLTNCTFTGNSATVYDGGGMGYEDSTSILTNCILWDNTASSNPHIYIQGTSSVTVTYSDIGPELNVYPGTGNIKDNPLFVDVDGPDNIVGTEDDNLRLLSGSPCIDAGDNSVVDPNSTDLDGLTRIVDGNCDSTATVDMGAYEFVPGDFDGDGNVDANDLDFFTDHWLYTDCNDVNDWCEGTDFDYSHAVDFDDFAILAKYWQVGK